MRYPHDHLDTTIEVLPITLRGTSTPLELTGWSIAAGVVGGLAIAAIPLWYPPAMVPRAMQAPMWAIASILGTLARVLAYRVQLSFSSIGTIELDDEAIEVDWWGWAGSVAWREEIRDYLGIRMRAEVDSVGSRTMPYYYVELWHEQPSRRVVLMRSAQEAWARDAAEQYADVFKLPILEGAPDDLTCRNAEDLGKSLGELARAKKLDVPELLPDELPDTVTIALRPRRLIMKVQRLTMSQSIMISVAILFLTAIMIAFIKAHVVSYGLLAMVVLFALGAIEYIRQNALGVFTFHPDRVDFQWQIPGQEHPVRRLPYDRLQAITMVYEERQFGLRFVEDDESFQFLGDGTRDTARFVRDFSLITIAKLAQLEARTS